MNVTLLHYNNYFNRIVKKEDILNAYKAADPSYSTVSNINFVPGDGITTSLILGTSALVMNFDYLIVSEVVSNVETILSRWFIMDENRTRDGQYEIGLRRDVIVDNYDATVDAACFIEKGKITSTVDPLIYNKEGMTFNQIKTSETLLKDTSKMPWLIGYVTQDKTRYPSSGYYESKAPVENVTAWNDVPQAIKNAIGTTKTILANLPGDAQNTGLKYLFYGAASYMSTAYAQFTYNTRTNSWSWSGSWTAGGLASGWTYAAHEGVGPSGSIYLSGSNANAFHSKVAALFGASSNIYSVYKSSTGYQNENDLSNLYAWNGRYIFDANGNLKKITITDSNVRNGNAATYAYNSTLGREFGNAITTAASQLGTSKVTKGTASGNYIQITLPIKTITVAAVASTSSTSTIKGYIPSNRIQVRQAPYDIFAIPYDTAVIKKNGSTIVTTNIDVSSQAAVALAQAGGNVVYDVQLLPYFPDTNLLGTTVKDHEIDLTGLIEDQGYTYIRNENDGVIGVIMWMRNSEFTFDIPCALSIPKEGGSITALDMKISNECDLYRLVSPNYSGQFEFSLAKNGGSMTKVNVDCTYKPYTPYIHINPDFGGLYGADFNDARGLICGGDFSIALVTDAWKNYQLNNKNYQQMFDREIQNLDVNNAYQKTNDIINATVGSFGGAAAGALAGAKAGPYGAIAGTAVGLIGGAVTGAIDVQRNEALRQENRQFKIDMYNYQLGNIQALPQSLARTSALSYNNKLFPMIEYYTCTANEKSILKNKLTYNGMTVMKIGQLNEFIGTGYVKGQIIRFSGLNQDNHMANAIYDEINKGVYL